MINDPVNQRHISDNPVASARMTTQSRPPGLAAKAAERTSLGHRLQRALTGGPNRRFPGLQPSPGGAASLSPFLNRRLGFPILALLGLLAASLLFLLPGGPLHAQEAAIEYAENGTDPVATYTATDPEGRPVYWSLATTDEVNNPLADLTAADNADADRFTISSGGVLSFKYSPDYEMPRDLPVTSTNINTYKVVVVASDDAPGAAVLNGGDVRKKAYEKVTVMVTDVDEPGMVALSAQQAQVNALLTATLTDGDATATQITAAKWKWEHSSTAAGPWTPILTATVAAYPPLGVEGKYLRVTATYTDGHGSGKTAQAVSANMVLAQPANNAAPVFPAGSGARSVDENSPPGANVGKPVVANDALGEVLTYALTDASTGGFRIDPATGQITVGPRTALDADTEATASYTVMVTATDPSGAGGDAPQAVIITVKNLNEAPMMTGGATRVSPDENTGIAMPVSTYTATDPESSDGPCVVASCTWSVSGTDAGDFEISNEGGTFGVLTFKKVPNYEMPADANRDNVYNVTVVATDKGVATDSVFDEKNKMTATRDVVITVKNVEEDGTVTLSAQQPKVGIMLTASVTDLDNVVASSVTWKWERDDGNTNTDDEEVIEGAKSATYTPTAKDDIGDDDNGFFLTAIATYTDGNGKDKDTAMATSANMVEARTDNAPKFGATETGKRSIEEGMTGPVGMGVKATDADTGEILTYSLSGPDMASFTISQTDDETTDDVEEEGRISVKSGVKLDHEAKSTYMVTVTATDPDGLSASIDVTIKVTDMDEAPEIIAGGLAISGPSSVSYAEDRTDLVATYALAGPDSDSGRWTTLGGADAGDFRISNSGVLTFARTPDYENPADADDNNVYLVTLNARDSENTAMRDVTITVTDVDENRPPEFPSPATTRQVAENTVAGQDIGAPVAATDADNDALTYVLGGTDAASFNIVRTTGQLRTEAALDYDTKNSYAVTVTASDSGGLSDSIDVTITVTDVDDMVTGETLLDRYDDNDNDQIDKDEVFRAIDDYFDYPDRLTKEEVFEIVDLYFAVS